MFKDYFSSVSSDNQKFSWLWALHADLNAPSSALPDPWGAGPSSLSWPTDAARRWESAHTSPVDSSEGNICEKKKSKEQKAFRWRDHPLTAMLGIVKQGMFAFLKICNSNFKIK